MADNYQRMTPRAALVDLGFLLPIVLFVLVFGLLPVALLFSQGVGAEGGVAGVAKIVSNPLNVRALDNSLVQGALSSLAAMVIGYPVGVFLGRYRWPGRSFVRALILVPFLLPTVVVVLGVLDLFGPQGDLSTRFPPLALFGRGLGGILAVNVYFNVSLVALLTAVGTERGSPDLEDAVATLGGSPARAYREVWGPPSWIGAAAGGLLTFLFSALAFAAPLLVCGARCYTLEVRVWSLDQQLLDPTAATVLAFIMVLLLAIPTALYLLLLSRLRPESISGEIRSRPIPWRAITTYPLVAITSLAVVSVLSLMGAVLYATFAPGSVGGPGSSWSALFGSHVSAVLGITTTGVIGNTLFFATVGASLALLFGVLTGYVLVSRPRATRPLSFYLFLPLLFSPVVLAFALTQFWRPILGGESTVWILILLSQTTLALPFAVQSLELPLRRISGTLRESARSLGAAPWLAYLDADLPEVRSGLVTGALFAFALCLGEFTATYFLTTSSFTFTTLSVEVYRLQGVRLFGAADAAAGLLIVVSFVTFLALTLGGRRVEL